MTRLLHPFWLPLMLLIMSCNLDPKGENKDTATNDESGIPADPLDADADGVPRPEDCDDQDPSIYPGALDPWYDGIDQDCAHNDDFDADLDGYVPEAWVGVPTLSVEGSGYLPGGDCWDEPAPIPEGFVVVSSSLRDAAGEPLAWVQPQAEDTHASAPETWYDGVDQDCDGADDFDQDGDGYRSDSYPSADGLFGPDCLDGAPYDTTNPAATERAAAHPGAEEIWYDGTDQDCDGDDGDQDRDGWCLVGYAFACKGSGIGDCDDTNPAAWPGASEVEGDGIDQDCDGFETCRADADADGHAPEGAPTLLSKDADCTDPGEALMTLPPDCDDHDAAAYPGADELCADGVDQDCDGLDPLCGPRGDHDILTETTLWIGEAKDDLAATAVAGAGDTDGDGLPEILLGAPHFGVGNGAMYVIEGPPWTGGSLGDTGILRVDPSTGDSLGQSLAGLGDLNGDGLDDVVVGAYSNNRAVVLYGPLSGPLSVDDGPSLDSTRPDISLGEAVGAPGDTDGDGLMDLLVGAPNDNAHGYGTGSAFLFRGPVIGDLTTDDAEARLIGETAFASAGSVLGNVGDLDSDGLDDVCVSAPFDSSGIDYGGAVYVQFGPVSGELQLSTADLRLYGTATMSRFGYAASGDGDVNGDGHTDLAIGASYDGTASRYAGAVFVFPGPLMAATFSSSEADIILLGEASEDLAGSAVAIDGDADGDGTDDLWVGAQASSHTARTAGAAYLVYGPVHGTVDLADAGAVYAGTLGRDLVGASLDFVGDADLDGYDDVLIGIPHGYAAGAASLILSGTAW